MSDHLDDLGAAVRSVTADVSPTNTDQSVELNLDLWKRLESLGFTSLAVREDLGGSGGDLVDAAAVIRIAGHLAVPLAEAMFLAGPLLNAAGIALPPGPLTAAAAPEVTVQRGEGASAHLTGAVTRVPWLRSAAHVVLLVSVDGAPAVAVVSTDSVGLEIRPSGSLSCEPRDAAMFHEVSVDRVVPLDDTDWPGRFELLGAGVRTVQMAGAASAVLDLTSRYVSERVQFGRALQKFQVVQHALARLAADVVTVGIAADVASLSLRDSDGGGLTRAGVASSKAEASHLAGRIAASSHQALGAIGYTLEHDLGAYTRRLWSWRDEFGNERHWWRVLGQMAMEDERDLWEFLAPTTTSGSDRA